MSNKPLGKPQKSVLADPFTQDAGAENDHSGASIVTQEAVLTDSPIPGKAAEMDTITRWHRRITLGGGDEA